MTDSTTVQKTESTGASHAHSSSSSAIQAQGGRAEARSAGRPEAGHESSHDHASLHSADEESGAAHGHVGSLVAGLRGEAPRKVNTVHTADGKTVESWHAGGADIQRTRFTSDGATVTRTRATLEDGTVRELDVARRGSTVDRTTSVSRRVDRPIDEVAAGHVQTEGAPLPGDPGTRQKVEPFAAAGTPSRDGSTVVTEVKHTVADTRDPHARPVTVDAFTSYKQSDPRPHDPTLQCVPGGQGVGADAAAASGFAYDPRGRTNGRSYSVTVNRISDGRRTGTVQLASQSTADYKTSGGRSGSITNASVLVVRNGRPLSRTQSTTARGVLGKDDVGQALGRQSAEQLSRSATPYRNNNDGAEKFGARLQDDAYRGPLDYRDTATYSYQNGASSHVTEVGDIDRANTPGSRTVTIAASSDHPQQTWNYREVQAPESGDGYRVQEQTDVEGSPNYEKSDITYRPDGTHDGWSHVYDADDAFVTATHDQTRIVGADDVRDFRDKGDAALNDDFLQRNPSGTFLEHSVSSQNWGPGAAVSSHTTFSARGTGDALSYAQAPTGHWDPASGETAFDYTDRLLHETPYTTALREPAGETPLRVTSPSNQRFTLEASGRAIVADADGGVAADVSTGSPVSVASSSSSLLNKTVTVLNGDIPAAMRAKGGILGAVAGVSGLLSGDGSDPVGSAGTLAGGVADLSKVSGKLLEGANAARGLFAASGTAARLLGPALQSAGRVLGPAGNLLGVASGLRELKDGDVANGALDTAAGAGGLVAAGSAAGFLPEAVGAVELGPVGLGVAALAVAGSLLLGIGQGPSQEDVWAQESKVADLHI